MKAIARISVVVAWSLLLVTVVQAQDSDVQEIQKHQQEVRLELQNLKGEMQLMRALLLEMQKSRAASAGAGLDEINKKLDTVINELAAIKKNQKPAAPKQDTTVYKINTANRPYKGPKDAAVTIVEFSEFQCPYCIREVSKIDKILAEYPKDVKLVYMHFPLSFHKKAPPAQAATVLAHKQLGNEGFWKMHDLIVAQPKKLDIPDLRQHAVALGLNLQAFDEVMADKKKIDALLADDIAEAKRCGVRGTPTVFINGLKLAKRSEADYKARIDDILKKKK